MYNKLKKGVDKLKKIYYTIIIHIIHIHIIHIMCILHTRGKSMKNTTSKSLVVTQTQGGELAPFTLSQALFSRWVSFIEAQPQTITTYRKAINYFLQWTQANGVTTPTRADILTYRDYLKANHKATTVKVYLTAVKLFFQWTAQEGLFPNIADHIKGAKLNNEFKKDYLTKNQVGKFLEKIDTSNLAGLRDFAITFLMVTTGLRTIEVVRADIGDLRTVADFTALYIQGKGRDEKAEYVKVPFEVEEAIRAYLNARGETNQQAPLFASISRNNKGGRLTTRAVSGICKGHLVEAGFNSGRLTAHSLRHTAATLNLLNGGTPRETQQLLRHKNINTTMIYSHNLDRAKNNSEERITRAILGVLHKKNYTIGVAQ